MPEPASSGPNSPGHRAPLQAGPVVVGFKPDLHPAIVHSARSLALAFDCDLVFAYVEPNSAVVGVDPLGPWYVDTITPGGDEGTESIALQLADTLAAELDRAQVRWSLRILAGDAATALSRLAVEVDARMLVVGTRRPGPMHRLEEFLAGSVAKALAMGQERPVLLVPMARRDQQYSEMLLETE